MQQRRLRQGRHRLRRKPAIRPRLCHCLRDQHGGRHVQDQFHIDGAEDIHGLAVAERFGQQDKRPHHRHQRHAKAMHAFGQPQSDECRDDGPDPLLLGGHRAGRCGPRHPRAPQGARNKQRKDQRHRHQR